MTHSILPATGISKFIFRIPFRKTPSFNKTIPDYKFTIRFSQKPDWVNCTRIKKNSKTMFEGVLTYQGVDAEGRHTYIETFGSAPVGIARVYTFKRG